MNDYRPYRGRGRGSFPHAASYRSPMPNSYNNDVRRSNPNHYNSPPLLPFPSYRETRPRWQRPQHPWRGAPRHFQYTRPYASVQKQTRPISPLPGSEEARQKAIAEASARIKQQLNLTESDLNCDQDVIIDYQNDSKTLSDDCVMLNDLPLQEENLHIGKTPDRKRKHKKSFSCSSNTTIPSTNIEELRKKILTQFTYMSKGKIQNLVNNPGSTRYDSALQHLVRDMRLHLSSELRNMYNNRDNDPTNENNKMIDHFNSIVPDLGVELVSLPDTMVAELSKILQLDVNNDLMESVTMPNDNVLIQPEDMFKQAEELLSSTNFLDASFDMNSDAPDNNLPEEQSSYNLPVAESNDNNFDYINSNDSMSLQNVNNTPEYNCPPENVNAEFLPEEYHENVEEFEEFSTDLSQDSSNISKGNNIAFDDDAIIYKNNLFNSQQISPTTLQVPVDMEINSNSSILLPEQDSLPLISENQTNNTSDVDNILNNSVSLDIPLPENCSNNKTTELLSQEQDLNIPLPESDRTSTLPEQINCESENIEQLELQISLSNTPARSDASPFSKKLLQDPVYGEIFPDNQKDLIGSESLNIVSKNNTDLNKSIKNTNVCKSKNSLFNFDFIWKTKPNLFNHKNNEICNTTDNSQSKQELLSVPAPTMNVTSFLQDVITNNLLDNIEKDSNKFTRENSCESSKSSSEKSSIDDNSRLVSESAIDKQKDNNLNNDESLKKNRIPLDERIKQMMKIKESRIKTGNPQSGDESENEKIRKQKKRDREKRKKEREKFELEKESARKRQIEREKQIEFDKQLERDKLEKQKQLEREIKLEKQIQKQKQFERDKQKQLEREKQKLIDKEKIKRLKLIDKQKLAERQDRQTLLEKQKDIVRKKETEQKQQLEKQNENIFDINKEIKQEPIDEFDNEFTNKRKDTSKTETTSTQKIQKPVNTNDDNILVVIKQEPLDEHISNNTSAEEISEAVPITTLPAQTSISTSEQIVNKESQLLLDENSIISTTSAINNISIDDCNSTSLNSIENNTNILQINNISCTTNESIDSVSLQNENTNEFQESDTSVSIETTINKIIDSIDTEDENKKIDDSITNTTDLVATFEADSQPDTNIVQESQGINSSEHLSNKLDDNNIVQNSNDKKQLDIHKETKISNKSNKIDELKRDKHSKNDSNKSKSKSDNKTTKKLSNNRHDSKSHHKNDSPNATSSVQGKYNILNRLVEIDVHIQKLMEEKWNLYKELNLTTFEHTSKQINPNLHLPKDKNNEIPHLNNELLKEKLDSIVQTSESIYMNHISVQTDYEFGKKHVEVQTDNIYPLITESKNAKSKEKHLQKITNKSKNTSRIRKISDSSSDISIKEEIKEISKLKVDANIPKTTDSEQKQINEKEKLNTSKRKRNQNASSVGESEISANKTSRKRKLSENSIGSNSTSSKTNIDISESKKKTKTSENATQEKTKNNNEKVRNTKILRKTRSSTPSDSKAVDLKIDIKLKYVPQVGLNKTQINSEIETTRETDKSKSHPKRNTNMHKNLLKNVISNKCRSDSNKNIEIAITKAKSIVNNTNKVETNKEIPKNISEDKTLKNAEEITNINKVLAEEKLNKSSEFLQEINDKTLNSIIDNKTINSNTSQVDNKIAEPLIENNSPDKVLNNNIKEDQNGKINKRNKKQKDKKPHKKKNSVDEIINKVTQEDKKEKTRATAKDKLISNEGSTEVLKEKSDELLLANSVVQETKDTKKEHKSRRRKPEEILLENNAKELLLEGNLEYKTRRRNTRKDKQTPIEESHLNEPHDLESNKNTSKTKKANLIITDNLTKETLENFNSVVQELEDFESNKKNTDTKASKNKKIKILDIESPRQRSVTPSESGISDISTSTKNSKIDLDELNSKQDETITVTSKRTSRKRKVNYNESNKKAIKPNKLESEHNEPETDCSKRMKSNNICDTIKVTSTDTENSKDLNKIEVDLIKENINTFDNADDVTDPLLGFNVKKNSKKDNKIAIINDIILTNPRVILTSEILNNKSIKNGKTKSTEDKLEEKSADNINSTCINTINEQTIPIVTELITENNLIDETKENLISTELETPAKKKQISKINTEVIEPVNITNNENTINNYNTIIKKCFIPLVPLDISIIDSYKTNLIEDSAIINNTDAEICTENNVNIIDNIENSFAENNKIAENIAKESEVINSTISNQQINEVENSTEITTDNEIDENGIFCMGHQKSILDIKIIGDEFFAASEDGTIYKYCLKSGHLQDAYTGHKRAVTCIYVTPGDILNIDSMLLYSGSLDCSLKCYNIETAEVVHSVVVAQAIQCLDSAWGYIFLGTYEGLLFTYNIKKKLLNEQSLTIANATVLMIKATQEGSRQVLILASRKREIMVRDAFTGLLLRTMCEDQKPTIYSLLLDRSQVYCGTSDKGILILDFHNGTQTGLYNSGKGVVCMLMYRSFLFAGCYDGLIYIYDTRTQKHVTTIPGPGEGMLLSLAISNDKIVAGSKKDHLLKIWKIPQEIFNQIDSINIS